MPGRKFMGGKGSTKGSVARVKADIKKVDLAIGDGIRAFREGASKGIAKAGLVIEETAREMCPKFTTQLSKTIGHYRVDAETAEEAELEYGKVQPKSSAVWEKVKWNHLVLGTQADYARAVHDRIPFLSNAVALKAGEIQRIVAETVVEEVRDKLKRHDFKVD